MDQHRVARLAVETVAGESEKYTASIVLLHGLWCTSASWRQFMGYLAHRGWTCHAVTWPGRAPQQEGVADFERQLREWFGCLQSPPILLGHDAGGTLALALRQVSAAVVALAPLLPETLALGSEHRSFVSRWFHSENVPPPRGRTAEARFGSGAPGGLIAETVSTLQSIERLVKNLGPSPIPALIVAGTRDPISPPSRLGPFGVDLGARFSEVDAGHAMPWEPGWEKRVGEVHRWLIRILGQSILIEREEDSDDEPR